MQDLCRVSVGVNLILRIF